MTKRGKARRRDGLGPPVPAAREAAARLPGDSPRRGVWIAAALTLALAALLAHALAYTFLTDDAYISFRYARNLSQGHGLVFNPGGERVEGYTNFLWVLILDGLNTLGVAPERAANPASLLATVALWILVLGFAWRIAPAPGREWLLLIPALFLAASRSFAVWSTGGLETRFFELAVVAGLFALVLETRGELRGSPAKLALSPWLFAIASWTRPDGILISLSAMLGAAIILARRNGGVPWRVITRWLPYPALVLLHESFRRLYYGEWLPNTYYVKVGGRLAWGQGLLYLWAFVLEYAAFLWIPAVIAALWKRGEDRLAPVILGAALVPYLAYVAAVGGDHFEYRPLDLVFPVAAVLLYLGARVVSGLRPGRWVVLAYSPVVLAGLLALPLASHVQFPRAYSSGFPGVSLGQSDEADAFLDPARNPVSRLPGLTRYARAHRDAVRALTARFVGIRQEEHRLFTAEVSDEARRIRSLMDRGLLPRDVYLAMDCVGVIPYVTGARTLDRLGLTDARVARQPLRGTYLAHSKHATVEYARERGVDLWFGDPVRLTCPVTSNRLLSAFHHPDASEWPSYGAQIDRDRFLLCLLPQGFEHTRARLPRLELAPTSDPDLSRRYLGSAISAYTDSLRSHPQAVGALRRLAFLWLLAGESELAREAYSEVVRLWPDDAAAHDNFALAQAEAGDLDGAIVSLERAIALTPASSETAERLGSRLTDLKREQSRRGHLHGH